MQSVLLGTLRDHLYMAYNVITVYTKIILTLPLTDGLYLSPIPNNVIRRPVELREAMRQMQMCVVKANNLIQSPLTEDDAGQAILQQVHELQKPVERIDRWAAAIESDRIMRAISLPGLKGKSAATMATEIREYMFDANQVLLFARVYALRWRRK